MGTLYCKNRIVGAFYGGGGKPSPDEKLGGGKNSEMIDRGGVIINNLEITKESKFDEYLDYNSSTGYFTVKKDCYLIIEFGITSYKSSGSNGLLDIYINEEITAELECSTTSTIDFYETKKLWINIKENDTFYLYQPKDRGWVKQGINIYLTKKETDENWIGTKLYTDIEY